jgi:ATP-dependent Clp protease ATP-binding subunit ClpA
MFERYTEPARRTIFYARAIAIINGAPAIESIHLLWSLMWPETFRAQVLFQLREKFPQYHRCSRNSLLIATSKGQDLHLTDEGKKILARTAMEADAMGDTWIDTDHLLLGILCESDCQAAQQLNAAGLTLENARSVAMENRSSRPDYGPMIPIGRSPSPRIWLMSKWCWWKARRSERRFAARRKK